MEQLILSAKAYDFKQLNAKIRQSTTDVLVEDCMGERFIGTGESGKTITVNGTPGNALGAYLDGADILVNGNTQDAVGDTMNNGRILINGNAGDALGYAMRGGTIYVKGNAGYRTGIHMKQYEDKKPVIVIGGRVGSFLGEYLAGGLIIVLGLDCETLPAGNFIGTGMHGGQIWLRSKQIPEHLPEQVVAEVATPDQLEEILEHIQAFSDYFKIDLQTITNSTFYRLMPNAKNPYKRLYTAN